MHRGFHDSSQNNLQAEGDLAPAMFPHSMSMAPVYEDFEKQSEIVGFVAGIVPWDLYLSRLLPEGIDGVYAVLSNSCSQTVTYLINGPVAAYLGSGDLHESSYDYLRQTLVFQGFASTNEESRTVGQCGTWRRGASCLLKQSSTNILSCRFQTTY